MNKYIRNQIIMWISFVILFFLATITLELFEGNKITTTAYYGLRNLGGTFIFFTLLIGIVLYPILFFLLSVLVTNFVHSLIIRIIIYTSIGGLSGIFVFNHLYGFSKENFIEGYDLQINNAIIIFSIVGLIYALLDYFFKKKTVE